MKNLIFFGLNIVVVFVFYSLFTGRAYLIWTMPGGLPFGNFLAALGLTAASASGICIHKYRSTLWMIALLSLMLSVAWLPVAIYQAGNMELNFSSDSDVSDLYFSGLTVLLAIFIFLTSVSVFVYKFLSTTGKNEFKAQE